MEKKQNLVLTLEDYIYYCSNLKEFLEYEYEYEYDKNFNNIIKSLDEIIKQLYNMEETQSDNISKEQLNEIPKEQLNEIITILDEITKEQLNKIPKEQLNKIPKEQLNKILDKITNCIFIDNKRSIQIRLIEFLNNYNLFNKCDVNMFINLTNYQYLEFNFELQVLINMNNINFENKSTISGSFQFDKLISSI